MTTDRIHKPTLNLDLLDAPIKSDKWTNIYFAKDGRSIVSQSTYPSEIDARATAASIVAKLANLADVALSSSGRREGTYDPSTDIMASDFSHHIQIPVKA